MKWLDKIKSFIGIEPDKLFYIGQEITPKTKTEWVFSQTKQKAAGPKFGEIVRCLKYDNFTDGNWFIKISGYGEYTFREECFAQVISDGELAEMLKGVEELAHN